MYCSEQLWYASAPHDHISSLLQPLLDLLGHTDGSVYVSVCVSPAMHVSVLMCVFKGGLLCMCVCTYLLVPICGLASGCCFSSSANYDIFHKCSLSEHTLAGHLSRFLSVLPPDVFYSQNTPSTSPFRSMSFNPCLSSPLSAS